MRAQVLRSESCALRYNECKQIFILNVPKKEHLFKSCPTSQCRGCSMAMYNQLKFKILWKLYHLGCWGKGHIAKRDVCKGLPPHEISACFGVLENLRKNGLVLRKKHKHGDPYRYFLNRKRYKEIREFLEKFES